MSSTREFEAFEGEEAMIDGKVADEDDLNYYSDEEDFAEDSRLKLDVLKQLSSQESFLVGVLCGLVLDSPFAGQDKLNRTSIADDPSKKQTSYPGQRSENKDPNGELVSKLLQTNLVDSKEMDAFKTQATKALCKLKKDLGCSICWNVLKAPISLQCGHSFCKDCIGTWTKSKPSCPICRCPTLSYRSYNVNLALSGVMKSLGVETPALEEEKSPNWEKEVVTDNMRRSLLDQVRNNARSLGDQTMDRGFFNLFRYSFYINTETPTGETRENVRLQYEAKNQVLQQLRNAPNFRSRLNLTREQLHVLDADLAAQIRNHRLAHAHSERSRLRNEARNELLHQLRTRASFRSTTGLNRDQLIALEASLQRQVVRYRFTENPEMVSQLLNELRATTRDRRRLYRGYGGERLRRSSSFH